MRLRLESREATVCCLFFLIAIVASFLVVFGPTWVQESFDCFIIRKHITRISKALEDVVALDLDFLVLGSPVVLG